MVKGTAKDFIGKDKRFEVTIDASCHATFRNFIVDYMKTLPIGMLKLNVSLQGVIEATAPGGRFVFVPSQMPDIKLQRYFPGRTLLQNDTLRGLERMLFFFQNGKLAQTDDDIFWIHEGFIEQYGVPVTHPKTGQVKYKRSSEMNTKEMGWLINNVLNEIASTDLPLGENMPEDIIDKMHTDLKGLWNEFYEWQFKTHAKDPYLDKYTNWEDYCKYHRVCEISMEPGTLEDPLVRMHIVSAGADGTIYEEPWNWIRAKQSIHQRQHTESWGSIIRIPAYKHIVYKINRAKELGKKKGVVECQSQSLNSNQEPEQTSQTF